MTHVLAWLVHLCHRLHMLDYICHCLHVLDCLCHRLHALMCDWFLHDIWQISVRFWVVIAKPSSNTWYFVIGCILWTWQYDVSTCDRPGIFPLYKCNLVLCWMLSLILYLFLLLNVILLCCKELNIVYKNIILLYYIAWFRELGICCYVFYFYFFSSHLMLFRIKIL